MYRYIYNKIFRWHQRIITLHNGLSTLSKNPLFVRNKPLLKQYWSSCNLSWGKKNVWTKKNQQKEYPQLRGSLWHNHVTCYRCVAINWDVSAIIMVLQQVYSLSVFVSLWRPHAFKVSPTREVKRVPPDKMGGKETASGPQCLPLLSPHINIRPCGDPLFVPLPRAHSAKCSLVK